MHPAGIGWLGEVNIYVPVPELHVQHVGLTCEEGVCAFLRRNILCSKPPDRVVYTPRRPFYMALGYVT